MTFTSWFPLTTDPIHIGDYHFRLKGSGEHMPFCRVYWDGEKFLPMPGTCIGDAISSQKKDYEWRGQTEEHAL